MPRGRSGRPDLVAHRDPAASQDVRPQATAVHQPAQDARLGESLQVGAGLAQAPADALGLADGERLAHQRVQVDPARDYVAARLLRASRRPDGSSSASISSASTSVSS